VITIALPGYLTGILTSLGFIFLSYILYKLVLYLEWKIFKTTKPQSPLHYKMFLLEQENEKLQKKISELEDENSRIINSLIKHLQG
jgi:hypothetical protein